MKIERNKVYNAKVTGEQLAIINLVCGNTFGKYPPLNALFDNTSNLFPTVSHPVPGVGTLDFRGNKKGEVDSWLNEVFPKEDKEIEDSVVYLTPQKD